MLALPRDIQRLICDYLTLANLEWLAMELPFPLRCLFHSLFLPFTQEPLRSWKTSSFADSCDPVDSTIFDFDSHWLLYLSEPEKGWLANDDVLSEDQNPGEKGKTFCRTNKVLCTDMPCAAWGLFNRRGECGVLIDRGYDHKHQVRVYHWEESQSNARWSAATPFPSPQWRLQEQCSGDVLVKQLTSNRDTDKNQWGVFHWTHEAKFVLLFGVELPNDVIIRVCSTVWGRASK